MTLNYIEKGAYLHKAIADAGFSLARVDGVWIADDETAVQGIIDTFDPLPLATQEAKDLIDKAASNARERYITTGTAQDPTYQMKLEDSLKFTESGYPEQDLGAYLMLKAEADALGVSGEEAANLVISTYNQWKALASMIENLRRKGSVLLQKNTEWRVCGQIAHNIVEQLNAV